MRPSSPTEIAYFIHGRGRGHASRSLPVARRLVAAGHQVTVYGGGDARDVLSEFEGWRTRDPLLPGPHGVVRFPLRIASDLGELSRVRPKLVVSDGDQGVLLPARIRGVPVLAIGHDLVFTCCALPKSAGGAALRYERASAALSTYLSQHRVAVHFLPIEPRRANTWVARPDGEVGNVMRGEHYVAYFRDANGGPLVRWLRAAGCDVRWFGPGATLPDGTPSPFADRQRFQRELRSARGVVGSAGSNLLAECVLYQKPMLAVFLGNDTEQILNARLAEGANVAMGANLQDVRRGLVERFVHRVEALDFAHVELADRLPPVSDLVAALAEDAVRG